MKTEKLQGKRGMLCASLFTGLVNGLFGSGGGMLAVVVLERIYGLKTDKAHATALMVMLPLSLISIAVYLFRGAIEWSNVPFVALGMVPGSLIGAKLLGKLKASWVDRAFCVLMLVAGIRLLF